jgi:hypothetical protein
MVFMGVVFVLIRNAEASSGIRQLGQRDVANMASFYVPMHSWVYRAFDLLAAQGYLQSAFFDLRPWSRLDCARLVDEAFDLTNDRLVREDIASTLDSLREEFAPELRRRTGENNRQILGSWIGREGEGEQLWATWQLCPRFWIELSGRSMNSSADLLRGGSLCDLRISADLALSPEWQLQIDDQAERWRFPLLAPRPQQENELTLQISYRPSGRSK